MTNAIRAVQTEVQIRKDLPAISADRFVPVMEVLLQLLVSDTPAETESVQYFVDEAEPAIAALNQMAAQLDTDTKALLEFFGEDASISKPEDLFQTLVTFSLALQQAEDEIRDEERKARKELRVKDKDKIDGRRSIGRGGFDKALRDLKSGTGLRRQRQEASVHRPQSRIFLDGARR